MDCFLPSVCKSPTVVGDPHSLYGVLSFCEVRRFYLELLRSARALGVACRILKDTMELGDVADGMLQRVHFGDLGIADREALTENVKAAVYAKHDRRKKF